MELWADIKGFENYYQISNLGNIKSMGHEFMCKDGKIKSRNPKILKPCVASTGYLHINLCRDGIRKSVTIHSLVANHFIDNPQNFKEIDHLNGIKNDNRVINLKWVTRQGNLLSQNWTHKKRVGKLRGVHHNLKSNKFISTIYLNGKSVYLGSFFTNEDAHSAYKSKLNEYNVTGKDMRG